MAIATRKVTASPGSFGHKLDRALSERKAGANTLAKLLSARYGGSVNNRRRAIIRWLQGATPEPYNRHKVEDALGVARDSLKGDDEDSEEDALAIDQLLTLRIRQIVRRELTR